MNTKELYVAYYDYDTAGDESGYLFMALGHSAIHAERVFDQQVGGMFEGCSEVWPLDQIEPFLKANIPPTAIETMQSIPAGSGHWFGCLFYDFS